MRPPGSFLVRIIRNFLAGGDGNVAITFALFSTVLFVAIGGGIDLSRAYNASQELTDVANLGCQYANRPSIVQNASVSGGGPAYVTSVTNFINASLHSQNFPFTQTNSTPFSYVQNGAANVSLTASVPTVFASIINITTIPISAAAHCYDTPSSVPQIIPNGNSTLLAQEGFENTAVCPSGYCYVSPAGVVGTNGGTAGTSPTPSTSFPSSGGYTGKTGQVWYIMGYCVEIDHVGVIKGTVPEGNFSAELDCDNGGGSAGNSSISTNIYLPAGSYELRYNYVSRVNYPNYNPTYLCGTTASDVSWANDTSPSGGPVSGALRDNQINVYLDANTTGSAPLHTTIFGGQKLAGSNLIDMCVYAQNWVERSVRITVTTAGYYWLSFAADGQNDSYGGQIDNIRLCNGTCAGSVQDNFPSAWTTTPTLFEDTFESPTYTANLTAYANTQGNLNTSYGTSGASSGWPGQSTSGWATAPYNEVSYNLSSTYAEQGVQAVELDSYNATSPNRAINRSFLLDPGYYKVSYYYISDAIFSGSSTSCAAAPSASTVAGYVIAGTASGSVRFSPSNVYTLNKDTNLLGVFMSNGQMVSTPIGGGGLNAQTSFNNPDGTVSTTPTVSPYGLSLSSYNASQNNPLIDICGYAASWQARTTYVTVTKPGYYWLTFAALGTGDEIGGAIDDVKLTAVGSLYGSAPSGTAVTIPVPAPATGSSYTNSGAFSGFSITADPLTVPAP